MISPHNIESNDQEIMLHVIKILINMALSDVEGVTIMRGTKIQRAKNRKNNVNRQIILSLCVKVDNGKNIFYKMKVLQQLVKYYIEMFTNIIVEQVNIIVKKIDLDVKKA